MKSKKVQVGILGCANIAERYAIPAFKKLDNVELVAIASRDKEKASAWAEKFNLEAESYESLITRTDIEVIYSPLPVGLQEEWAIKAGKAGKHVICEKSITYSFDSAKRMVDAFGAKNLALYENFVPEFHPQHARILSLIADGSIGEPRVLRAFYGFPGFPANDIRLQKKLHGGSLNDCGCYTVFMARKIFDAEPLAVTCSLSQGVEVDMHGSALLEFPIGTALLGFGFDQMYQNTYSVWGSKGMVGTKRAFAIPPDLKPPVELVTNNGKEERTIAIDVPAANQFMLSFKYVCDAIARSDTAEFALMRSRILQQAKVMEAMRQSAREGKRVKLVSGA